MIGQGPGGLEGFKKIKLHTELSQGRFRKKSCMAKRLSTRVVWSEKVVEGGCSIKIETGSPCVGVDIIVAPAPLSIIATRWCQKHAHTTLGQPHNFGTPRICSVYNFSCNSFFLSRRWLSGAWPIISIVRSLSSNFFFE